MHDFYFIFTLTMHIQKIESRKKKSDFCFLYVEAEAEKCFSRYKHLIFVITTIFFFEWQLQAYFI